MALRGGPYYPRRIVRNPHRDVGQQRSQTPDHRDRQRSARSRGEIADRSRRQHRIECIETDQVERKRPRPGRAGTGSKANARKIRRRDPYDYRLQGETLKLLLAISF